ncbi:hypothetical protein TWF281_003001 [Arthrobotrys megalospora]
MYNLEKTETNHDHVHGSVKCPAYCRREMPLFSPGNHFYGKLRKSISYRKILQIPLANSKTSQDVKAYESEPNFQPSPSPTVLEAMSPKGCLVLANEGTSCCLRVELASGRFSRGNAAIWRLRCKGKTFQYSATKLKIVVTLHDEGLNPN